VTIHHHDSVIVVDGQVEPLAGPARVLAKAKPSLESPTLGDRERLKQRKKTRVLES
jgi:hypothetical protein